MHIFAVSFHFPACSLHKSAHLLHNSAENCTFGNVVFSPYVCLTSKKHGPAIMAEHDVPAPAENKAPQQTGKNPFASGFVPNGRRKKKSQSYLTKKNLLKYMLDVDLTIQDLPTRMADDLRILLPGWFESVEKRFTMRQIMELVQFQLLFSKSDYVRQDAINAIKDRVDGKAVQKVAVDPGDIEETVIVLPNGRKIAI